MCESSFVGTWDVIRRGKFCGIDWHDKMKNVGDVLRGNVELVKKIIGESETCDFWKETNLSKMRLTGTKLEADCCESQTLQIPNDTRPEEITS